MSAALATAGDAQAAAYSAQSTANAAQSTANAAQTAVNGLQAVANEARDMAGTAQDSADRALAVSGNSAQYADEGRTLGLNGNAGAGTRIVNVAAGSSATDAVNFGQLQAVMTELLRSGVCRVSGGAVRCGSSAAANAIELGSTASVAEEADNAVAIGANASAQAAGGIAIGDHATAVRSNSVAIGAGASARSSVAIGAGSQAMGANSTALGDAAVASGDLAVAIGNNARAVHANSVAIGNGSVTEGADTVSIGSPGAERRLARVADGIDPTDAVNVRQIDALRASAEAGRSAISALDSRMDSVEKSAYQGVAMAAALAQQPLFSESGKGSLTVGLGSYKGYQALGISYSRLWASGRAVTSIGVATSGDGGVVRAGASFAF